jgi:hypothetical protein
MTHWRPPTEFPQPPDTKVIIIYRHAFFRQSVLEIDFGYYDSPDDDDGYGCGWALWEGEVPVECVAWMPLPKSPEVKE